MFDRIKPVHQIADEIFLIFNRVIHDGDPCI